jgi:hypothetical protein
MSRQHPACLDRHTNYGADGSISRVVIRGMLACQQFPESFDSAEPEMCGLFGIGYQIRGTCEARPSGISQSKSH